jgi:hypothetical protein
MIAKYAPKSCVLIGGKLFFLQESATMGERGSLISGLTIRNQSLATLTLLLALFHTILAAVSRHLQ